MCLHSGGPLRQDPGYLWTRFVFLALFNVFKCCHFLWLLWFHFFCINNPRVSDWLLHLIIFSHLGVHTFSSSCTLSFSLSVPASHKEVLQRTSNSEPQNPTLTLLFLWIIIWVSPWLCSFSFKETQPFVFWISSVRLKQDKESRAMLVIMWGSLEDIVSSIWDFLIAQRNVFSDFWMSKIVL